MSVLPLSKLALGKVALYVLGEKQVTFQQTNTELVLAATLANGSPETLFQLSVLLKAFLDAIETDMGMFYA
jgi:hypothetical protein